MYILSLAYDVGYDWLMTGFAKLLVIMAILQLVKKIPDIINTVFGTKIQTKGGIKGRLGEMAGIGGIAQKAWTSLGNGAKNLAKLGITAPAALGYALGNSVYKKKYGQNLSDTKAGRIIRGGVSGLGSAVKTGSWLKTKDAAVGSYNKTSATPLEKARNVQRTNEEIDNIVMKDDGTGTGGKNSIVNETNVANKNTANQQLDKRISARGGKNVEKANDRYQKMVTASNFAQAISKNMSAVLAANEEAASHFEIAGRNDIANKIREANEQFRATGNVKDKFNQDGTLKEKGMLSFITENADLYDKTVVNNLIGTNGKLMSIERQRDYIENTNLGLTQNDKDNFTRGEAAISFLANTTLKGKMDSAKTNLDIELAGAGLSEMDKMAVEKYISAQTDIGNSMAFAIGRNNTENGLNSSISGYTIEEITAMGAGTQTSGVQPTPPAAEPRQASRTSIIQDSSGNPIQMPVEEETTVTHTPTVEENDDRHEREWTARIEELNHKRNLTPEEREEREELIKSIQRIAADRMERNGGTLDE